MSKISSQYSSWREKIEKEASLQTKTTSVQTRQPASCFQRKFQPVSFLLLLASLSSVLFYFFPSLFNYEFGFTKHSHFHSIHHFFPLHQTTFQFSILWFFLCGFAHSAGYHRCFAHESFSASPLVSLYFLLFGAANFQGSALEYARKHHRFHFAVEADKYSAAPKSSLWWVFTVLCSPFVGLETGALVESEISTSLKPLDSNWLIFLQDQFYVVVSFWMGIYFPGLISAFFWNDFWGGIFLAGIFRGFIFHSLLNFPLALCFLWGTKPFDGKISPRDNRLLSWLTFGECELNFHYTFPSSCFSFHGDFIGYLLKGMSFLGLIRSLKLLPKRDISQVYLLNQQLELEKMKKQIVFEPQYEDLPLMSLATMKDEIKNQGRKLFIMDQMIFDLTEFISTKQHPGGEQILLEKLGCDITISFNGGVQRHSKAARNLASMFRVARLEV